MWFLDTKSLNLFNLNPGFWMDIKVISHNNYAIVFHANGQLFYVAEDLHNMNFAKKKLSDLSFQLNESDGYVVT